MTYAPIAPEEMKPGAEISTHAAAFAANTAELWEVETHIASAMGLQAFTVSTSYVQFGWARLYGDLDNVEVVCYAYTAMASASSNGSVKLDVGGVTDTATVSGTAGAWRTLNVTPTGGSSPRDIAISISGQSGNNCALNAVAIWAFPPSGVTAGVQASGFTRLDSAAVATNEPLTSEHMSRLISNPYHIARDRPVTLFSFMHATDRSDYEMTGTTRRMLLRGRVVGDGFPRKYRVDTYATAPSGGTPTLYIKIAGNQIEHEGAGWNSSVISGVQMKDVEVVIDGKNSASNPTRLGAVQIMREPA